MNLTHLLPPSTEIPVQWAKCDVQHLSANSRELDADTGFVALAGKTTHGLRYLETAQRCHCPVVLFDPESVPEDITVEAKKFPWCR